MELHAENLSVDRGGRRIVDAVGFVLPAGGALVVTGENGSGKSTLLKAIAGLLPLSGGRLEMRGGGAEAHEVREVCHYLGHQNAMKSALTVRENLAFWQDFCGDPWMSVEEALEEVNLSHAADLPYAYLSAGQKRRAAIARLLVSEKPLWILDEPTAALDAASSDLFRQIVEAYCDTGGMVIAATHLPLGVARAHELRLERLNEAADDGFSLDPQPSGGPA